MMKALKLLFLLFLPLSLSAQSPSTEGTDFWVAFLFNCHDTPQPEDLSLIITGKPCTGVVSNPNTGYTQSFTVSRDTITNVSIPLDQCYPRQTGVPLPVGLHITTSDTVSLYASNYQFCTFDITNVLPTPTLTNHYMVQTYGAQTNHSEFAVVAVEDSTLIDITPTCNSIDNALHADETTTIVLNSGEVYMQSAFPDDGFSGTVVASRDCKPIAVFDGNRCTGVPVTSAATDHIYEQSVPTAYWGRRFVVTSSMLRSKDRVRITALRSGCVVYRNGVYLTTLRAGKTFEYQQDSLLPAVYLETSQPAAVYLYFTGYQYGGENGDPSMVLISPVEQRMRHVTFGTFTTQATNAHFVNIVAESADTSGITLDGNPVGSFFEPVPCNSQYSFARIPIVYGSHTLHSLSGGFVAHIYGLGRYESYSYSVGSNANPLNQLLFVNEVPVSLLPDHAEICLSDTLRLRLETDAEVRSLQWSFGDGTSGSGVAVSHLYQQPGDYLIRGRIAYAYAPCGGSLYDSVLFPVRVKPSYLFETVADTCRGSYLWRDSLYHRDGVYHDDFQAANGCDSNYLLQLRMHTIAHAAIHANPPYADDDHPTVRLSDHGSGAVQRLWSLRSLTRFDKEFDYAFPSDCDSVRVMLVARGVDDCPDTAFYDLRCERLRLWIPNVFTPRAQNNERFRVVGSDLLDVEVVIYDRMGRVVGRFEGADGSWDGTCNGIPVPQGAYRYTVRYTSSFEPNRIRFRQGTVTLLY